MLSILSGPQDSGKTRAAIKLINGRSYVTSVKAITKKTAVLWLDAFNMKEFKELKEQLRQLAAPKKEEKKPKPVEVVPTVQQELDIIICTQDELNF